MSGGGFVVKDGKKLSCGFTTGSCAAAAAKAAAEMLLSGAGIDNVRITTPNGVEFEAEILDITRGAGLVRCAVRKDGGDDPDVTHGALIYAEVTRHTEFEIDGGAGVGRVTRRGLSVKPGDAAINPVPKKMIESALREAAAAHGNITALRAVISVPGGGEIAEHTFNPQLGIEGGISILGTSGIVEPMSERALISTIQLEIDIVREIGGDTLLITPGNYGRDFASALGIDTQRGVKCSNYMGEALDYAKYKGFSDVLIVGHAGKLIKLAAGIFQTHSKTADGRREILCTHAALSGAPPPVLRDLMEAVSVDAAIPILRDAGICRAVFDAIGREIDIHLKQRLRGSGTRAEFIMFSNEFGELARSQGAEKLIGIVRETE